ncbi:MAG: hypothetical protein FWG66_00220 [Spirochaetes bacterium]|nr:hypothetical protein [Spirochaetota bacterium]
MKSGILALVLALIVTAAVPLSAEQGEPYSFVGMTLEQLIAHLGAPISVHASRGIEYWQDDVVFQYIVGNFYIVWNRVWQVSLSNLRGIRLGDPRAAVFLTLGDGALDQGSHVVYRLPSAAWPMALRVSFNEAQQVNGIFVYRSDL